MFRSEKKDLLIFGPKWDKNPKPLLWGNEWLVKSFFGLEYVIIPWICMITSARDAWRMFRSEKKDLLKFGLKWDKNPKPLLWGSEWLVYSYFGLEYVIIQWIWLITSARDGWRMFRSVKKDLLKFGPKWDKNPQTLLWGSKWLV